MTRGGDQGFEGRSRRGWITGWYGDRPFRTKILLLISLVTSVALGVFGMAVLLSSYFEMRTDAVRNATVLADVIAANSTAPLSFGDADSAVDLLQSLKAEPLFQFARLVDEKGDPLATCGDEGVESHNAHLALQMTVPQFHGRLLTLSRPVTLDDEHLGMLVLTFNLGPKYRALAQKGVMLLGLIFAAWVIAFLLSSRIQRILTRPVLHLSEIARQVLTEESYEFRAEKFNSDELGELTDAFNDMLDLIQLRDSALEQSRQELEIRVAERTADLAQTNKILGNEIEERGRIEMELRTANALAEESTRAKSDFLANMSHEIRTPMTAILGYSDLLMNAGQTAEQRTDCIQTIRRNGEHLLGLINDILDISKIEAGKMTVEHIECSPMEILSDVTSLMRVRAQEKDLALDIEYAFPIPEKIQSDPVRLKQILINLVGNAIKFTESGGVRLIVRCDEAGGEEARLRIEVVDTGIGMTEEQIEHIFQPFSQADTSTTRQFGGTGLGLSISKRLAELLGGEIVIESTPGEGSSFMVTLQTGGLDGVSMLQKQREEEIPQNPQAPAAPHSTQLSARILLAEDGPDNQRLISFHLKKAGAEVEIAENGRIAYDRALAEWKDETPFDIILMDMQMPVMDGYEATTELRHEGYTGPIIALTAHAMAGDREKCLAAGCDDYTTKPITKEVLLGVIQSHLSDTMIEREVPDAF